MKKIKKIAVLFFSAILLLTSLPSLGMTAFASDEIWQGDYGNSFDSGSGSKDDPFIIKTPEQFAYFYSMVNNYGEKFSYKYICLEADIYLNDITEFDQWGTLNDEGSVIVPVNKWYPIGSYDYFDGYFDGKGHTIYGMYCEENYNSYVGLFGGISATSKVENLNVKKSYVKSNNSYDNSMIGGIVGICNGKVINCTFDGKVISTSQNANAFVGGVVGLGNVENSINYASVEGPENVGGISGSGVVKNSTNFGEITSAYGTAAGIGSWASIATNCVNKGKITGFNAAGIVRGIASYCYNEGEIISEENAAGIAVDAYFNDADDAILNCYNKGNITASYGTVGGITSNGIPVNCYNSGNITITENNESYSVGGIVGYAASYTDAVIENCYNVGQISFNSGVVDSIVAGKEENIIVKNCYSLSVPTSCGTVLTEEEMAKKESFTGFDFNKVWEIGYDDQYSYPTLKSFGSKEYLYSVKFYDQGLLVEEKLVGEQDTLNMPARQKNGYVFLGWTKDAKVYAEGEEYSPVDDTLFSAVWQKVNTSENVWDGQVDTDFSGDGTESAPYLITSSQELAGLAQNVNEGQNYNGCYFKLTTDIYLNDSTDLYGFDIEAQNRWTPIGRDNGGTFQGHFDGQGYTVYGVYLKYITSGSISAHKGLFGYINNYGSVKNLNVKNSYFGYVVNSRKTVYMGSVAGMVIRGEMSNCQSEVKTEIVMLEEPAETMDYLHSYAGGLVGMSDSTVKDCINKGSITVRSLGKKVPYEFNFTVGGIAGSTQIMENCVNNGNITVKDIICYDSFSEVQIGGITGTNKKNIKNSINNGNITEELERSKGSLFEVNVGGIAYLCNGNIENCINNGDLSSANEISGIAKCADTEDKIYNIKNCVNNGTIYGKNTITRYEFSCGGISVGTGSEGAFRSKNTGDIILEVLNGDIGGIAASGKAEECLNEGKIIIENSLYERYENSFVGGIVGNGTAINCYNKGSITVRNSTSFDADCSYIGGIVGQGTSQNCYNSGGVFKGITVEEHSGSIGGISGSLGSEVYSSYYLSSTVPVDSGLGEEISLSDLSDKKTFNGWNFKGVWEMNEAPTLICFGSNEYYYQVTMKNDSSVIFNKVLKEGSEIEITAPGKQEKYDFAYYESDGTYYYEGDKVTLNRDMTFTAVWKTKNTSENVWDGTVDTEFSGDGTESSPYLITNSKELAGLSSRVENGENFEGIYFKQTADIVLNDYSEDFSHNIIGSNAWTPIGTSFTFKGVYDGDSHKVTGIYIKENLDKTHINYAGLFGRIQGATVKNVIIENVFIKGYGTINDYYVFCVGAVAGEATENSVIDGCSVISGNLICDSNYYTRNAGGILGDGENVQILNCTNYANVDGYYSAGIVVTLSGSSSVVNCKNYGNINSDCVGGIVCEAYNNSIIDSCFNYGKLEGRNVGGIVYSASGDILNCINDGQINGETCGGIVCSATARISNCINNGDITVDCENNNSYGYSGGIAGYAGSYIRNCVNNGDIVSLISKSIGGIAGETDHNIIDCVNNGNLTSSSGAAGIVCCTDWSNYTNITNCCNNGNVIASADASGIVATAYRVTVENSYNMGKIQSGFSAGGIVSYANRDDLRINKCYNVGEIISQHYAGGIIGYSNDSGHTVLNSYNIGNVIALNDAGGIIGKINDTGIQVLGCYNSGNISGNDNSGGIVGAGYSKNNIFKDCYNTGDITSKNRAGGILGAYGSVQSSYNIGSVSARESGAITGYGNAAENSYYLDGTISATNDGATLLTENQMKNASSFAGFDFNEIWTIDGESEYPYPTCNEVSHTVTYTVTFLDSDGQTVLKTQQVMKGYSAYPPYVEPVADGNTVKEIYGWEGSYTNITKDTVVKAKYKETTIIKLLGKTNEITVPFGYSLGNLAVDIESAYSRLLCTTTNDYKMMCKVDWDFTPYNPSASGEYIIKGNVILTDSLYYDMAEGEEIIIKVKVLPSDNPNAFDVSDLKYSQNGDSTITITGYNGNAEEIYLPNKIGGKAVTAIGENAFKDNENLRTVVIPEGVKVIGAGAFQNCYNLTLVTLCEGVEEIGENAFANTHITNITLPSSVKAVGSKAIGYFEDETVGGFVIYCYEGNIGQEYGQSNSIATVTVKLQEDTKTGITAITEDGVDLNVAVVGDGSYFETATNIKEDAQVSLFEIKILDSDEKEVQPGNLMTISIPVPLGFDPDTCAIYRINSDGSYKDMNAVLIGDRLVFNTAHLSYYAIISAEKDVLAGDVNGNGEIDITDLAVLKIALADNIADTLYEGADINMDGEVNVTDLAKLKIYLANN